MSERNTDSDKSKLKDNSADPTQRSKDSLNNTKNLSLNLLHANLIEQVFKKLELISINSIIASNTAASSFLNSYDNFCSKNLSINPKLASLEDDPDKNDDDLNFIRASVATKVDFNQAKSLTLTRKYSSKEQQKEHDQQKRQSIKSHSSLKNLSNIPGCQSTNSLSFIVNDTTRHG